VIHKLQEWFGRESVLLLIYYPFLLLSPLLSVLSKAFLNTRLGSTMKNIRLHNSPDPQVLSCLNGFVQLWYRYNYYSLCNMLVFLIWRRRSPLEPWQDLVQRYHLEQCLEARSGMVSMHTIEIAVTPLFLVYHYVGVRNLPISEKSGHPLSCASRYIMECLSYLSRSK